jgi:iron-sulfur cluster assembly protein
MSKMEENLDDVIASLIDFDEQDAGDVDSIVSKTSDQPNGDLSADELPKGDPEILLTEYAAKEIRRIMQTENLDESLRLRVAVEGGGCSGLSYKLGFDHQTEEDLVCESQGLEIIIDPRHALYLDRCEIDYPQGLDARGFVFNNPNASESCGCGTSFAV